jgi:hypothetical protein
MLLKKQIGKVVAETATMYTVSKPLCMVGTDKGFQFAPFIMMGDMDADVEVPRPAIQTTPNEKILEQYEAATSPIALPKKGSIII